MSESDSEFRPVEETYTPETGGELLKEIFVRILAGLGVVGRGLRGGFVATGTCVKHTIYPIKESCVYIYDEASSYLNPSTARAGREVPQDDVVCFQQSRGELEDDAFQPSPRG